MESVQQTHSSKDLNFVTKNQENLMSLKPEAKILFVSHKYPPSIGGMQKQSFELITGMSQLTSVEKIVLDNKCPSFIFVMLSLPRTWYVLIKNPSIEIVHAIDTLMALFLAPLLLLKKRKLVVTVHGLDIMFRFRPLQRFVSSVLSRYHLIIAVSKETRRECINRGIPKEKIIFIPNAIDFPENEKKDPHFIATLEKKLAKQVKGKKLLLSVGRPVPRKGFSWFVENVMPQLETDCIYMIVGAPLKRNFLFRFLQRMLPDKFFRICCQMNGISMDSLILEEFSKNSELSKFFILSGKLSDGELTQIYLHANLFVMPNRHIQSDFEGFGLVALEAGVRGVPCLASAVDGIPSAVQDEINGYLLPELDILKWTEKIDNLLQMKDLASIGEKFKQNIIEKDYSWQKMAQRYKEEFDKLIN